MTFGLALVSVGVGWWLVSTGLAEQLGHGAATVWSGVSILALSFLWRER